MKAQWGNSLAVRPKTMSPILRATWRKSELTLGHPQIFGCVYVTHTHAKCNKNLKVIILHTSHLIHIHGKLKAPRRLELISLSFCLPVGFFRPCVFCSSPLPHPRLLTWAWCAVCREDCREDSGPASCLLAFSIFHHAASVPFQGKTLAAAV